MLQTNFFGEATMRRTLVLAAMLAGLMTRPAIAQTIDAGEVKIKLIGRVQTQFSTTSVDEAELIAAGRSLAIAIPESMFETRRIRFGAEVEYQKWLTGKVEMEFGMGRLQVRDAFMNLGIDQRFQFRVGQFKKPFSLMQLTSSASHPMIERGVRIRGLLESIAYQDSIAGGTRVIESFRAIPVIGEEQDLLENFLYQNFDLGAAAHGRFGPVGYSVGVFNGAGWDRPDDTDSKSYAGRVTYRLPIEMPITFGTAISHREFRTANRPTIQTDDGTAYEVDVEAGAFRRPGVHFLGEVVLGDNQQDAANDFLGAQGILTWFAPVTGKRVEGIEFGGRVSYGDPRRDVADDQGLLITPALNIYFAGRNRLMFNWDFFRLSDRFTNENALRAQAQFSF
jgi:hypothetical protein